MDSGPEAIGPRPPKYTIGPAAPSGPKASIRPTASDPVPDGLDWDLWLGPSPRASVQITSIFLFRGAVGPTFGCGALGRYGLLQFSTPSSASSSSRLLRPSKPAPPIAIRKLTRTHRSSTSIFPQRGDMPPVKFTWYDGGLKPPRPRKNSKPTRPLHHGRLKMEKKVSFSSVTKEKILCGFKRRQARASFPTRKNEGPFSRRPKLFPRFSGKTKREWLDAAKRRQKTKNPAAISNSPRSSPRLFLLGKRRLPRTGQKIKNGIRAQSPKSRIPKAADKIVQARTVAPAGNCSKRSRSCLPPAGAAPFQMG